MFEKILHVLLHTLEESILTLPVLFICYLLIELLEDKILRKYKTSKLLKNKWAPVVSAGFGLIPQCGFSVVATDLYSKKAITIGSLMAIFIATSDEALPLLLANPKNYISLAIIMGVKFIYAIIIGLSVDLFVSARNKKKKQLLSTQQNKNIVVDVSKNSSEEKHKEEHNHDHKNENDHDHEHEEEHNKNEEITGCCHHNLNNKHNKIKDLFIHPLIHSVKIFAFILLFSFVFGLIVEFVGKESITNFMLSTGFFEPFITAMVGIIPNCAASVLITQVFLMGGISIGSCIAGLCMNSGIAIIMLFKMNKNVKNNLIILSSLYLLSCAIGIIINLII